jgi:hypothetical protein
MTTVALEVAARRATIDRAPLIVAAVSIAAEPRGYAVGLYGSVAKHGEGRDYDLMVWPTRLYPPPAELAELLLGLQHVGFDIRQLDTDGLPGYAGILATFEGYAVDITVRP